MYRRIVFASTQGIGYQDATEALEELSELTLLSKRVWRGATRIGKERVEECRAAAKEYLKLTLPERRKSPPGESPPVACVQMDGGRFQTRKRVAKAPDADETSAPEAKESSDSCWSEYKAGVLLSMTSKTHREDPCPELPATFADPGKIREMAREIKGFTTSDSQASTKAEDDEPTNFEERPGRPEIVLKSVVATSGNVETFGPLLASAAYERGFHPAKRKAFVADGSSANWGVWSRYFSHYTPILDFVHALMYVYAGAMTGRGVEQGWADYQVWAQWLWSGQARLVIEALEARQQELGLPEKHETGTPRAQVANSLGYLRNQRGRMKYDEYRKQGLPITSSAIESTIKQINRRVKGTEKFWSEGGDAMLHLMADRLSQTKVTADFWDRRVNRLIASANQQQAA